MHLVTAIRILVNPETSIFLNAKVKILLETFVKDNAGIYSHSYIDYNVQSLLHITFFVLKHGPLEYFSCFKYENYLKELKKCMICARFPLQEVSNRIMKILTKLVPFSESKYLKFSKELLRNQNTSSDIVYEKVILGNFFNNKDSLLIIILSC